MPGERQTTNLESLPTRVARLEKENERLRAALKEIADISPCALERGDNPAFVIDIAKEALNG